MSIQLKYTEDFSDGLKRLMIDQCEKALKFIDAAKNYEEKHKAVHESRKAFKKVRACLRLVRDSIDFYDEENKFFRDLGRTISDVRDSVSNLETLELIKEQYDENLYQNSFLELEKDLKNYRDELAEKTFEVQKCLTNIEEKLVEKLEEIPGWRIEIAGFDDIKSGIKRTYKRGRKGKKRAEENGAAEEIHEWRKRAKYLRYQVDVINRVWPQAIEAYEDELHDITDLLGLHHDLEVLKKTIEERKGSFSDPQEKILFFSLIEKQQDFMKRHGTLKGHRCYFDSPSDFVDRLEVCWKAHRSEVEDSLLPGSESLEY
ncbi:CHAD domain-containing protein [Halocola ammonii]